MLSQKGIASVLVLIGSIIFLLVIAAFYYFSENNHSITEHKTPPPITIDWEVKAATPSATPTLSK